MLRPIQYFIDRFHEEQEIAWLAYKAGKDLVLDWGRRSGKTELEAEILIEDVETSGYSSMYCAITQKQARDIFWPKLVRRLKNEPHWKPNQVRLTWTYKGGPEIVLKGTDEGVDRLRGDAKRVIVLDEKAFYRNPEVLEKEVVAPMLADYNGQLITSSTPKGKNHFFKLKQKALKNPAKFYTSKCTLFQNPFIPQQGKIRVLEEYDGENDPLYRQEILCEYLDYQGKAFAIDPELYVKPRLAGGVLEHAWHWRGLDHGYSPDPTACVWLAYDRRTNHLQIINEYKQAALLIHKHAETIKSIESFPIIDTYADVDPQVIAEYNAVNLPCTAAHKYDKEARILRIVTMLRTGQLSIASHCKGLLTEIENYEWGQDGNDHLIDAMIYAVSNYVVPVEVQKEYAPLKPYKEMAFDAQSFGEFD